MTNAKTDPTENDWKQILIKAKKDFDKNWLQDSPSSSERLDEFTFLKILGQGAFGYIKTFVLRTEIQNWNLFSFKCCKTGKT